MLGASLCVWIVRALPAIGVDNELLKESVARIEYRPLTDEPSGPFDGPPGSLRTWSESKGGEESRLRSGPCVGYW